MKQKKPLRTFPQLPELEHKRIAEELIDFLKKELYLPLLRDLNLPSKTIRNDIDHLTRFRAMLVSIDAKLAQLSPLYAKLELSKLFHLGIFQLNKTFKEKAKSLSIGIPELSKADMEQISKVYEGKAITSLKKMTERRLTNLRKKVQELYFKGDRYETAEKGKDSLVEIIRKDFNTSRKRATFIARQETKLIATSFKEKRYADAGIVEYRWVTVKGSPKHPVRPYHKALDGTIQRFDSPPVVDKFGKRANPGQDYNCRCIAVPIIT